VRADLLPLEEKVGIFPFAEIHAAAAAEHEILTVCSACPTGETHGTLTLTQAGGTWRVQGTHGGRKVDVSLTAAGNAAPTVQVVS
jgi:hypothetical protein